MYTKSMVSALAASLFLNVAALPAGKRQTGASSSATQTGDSVYSTLSRLNPVYNETQLTELKLAYTEVDKEKLLRSYGETDDYFKFDFTAAGFPSNAANGLGGQGYLAAVQNFPILMNTGISMAIGYLNPCGLDSMHIHNRATEMVILVKGTSLKTGFVLEDGFDSPVYTELGLYQGAIRPQGSIHWEFNDNCDQAVFIAGLSSEDPGVSRTAQNFFNNPTEVVQANLGYPSFLKNLNSTEFAGEIPKAFAQGALECYQRCGLPYNTTVNPP